MRRLLNVKVIKTRVLENMLIIVFILSSRPGGLASHVCWSYAGRVGRMGMGLAVGMEREKEKVFTNTDTDCGFSLLTTQPHAWSSAGVRHSSMEFIIRTNIIIPLKIIVCDESSTKCNSVCVSNIFWIVIKQWSIASLLSTVWTET